MSSIPLTAAMYAQNLDDYFTGNTKYSHYSKLEGLFRVDYRKYLDKTGESLWIRNTIQVVTAVFHYAIILSFYNAISDYLTFSAFWIVVGGISLGCIVTKFAHVDGDFEQQSQINSFLNVKGLLIRRIIKVCDFTLFSGCFYAMCRTTTSYPVIAFLPSVIAASFIFLISMGFAVKLSDLAARKIRQHHSKE